MGHTDRGLVLGLTCHRSWHPRSREEVSYLEVRSCQHLTQDLVSAQGKRLRTTVSEPSGASSLGSSGSPTLGLKAAGSAEILGRLGVLHGESWWKGQTGRDGNNYQQLIE